MNEDKYIDLIFWNAVKRIKEIEQLDMLLNQDETLQQNIESGTKCSRREIGNKIIKVVEKYPGLKARKIAELVEEDKKLVNSILYRELVGICYQDENYKWYIS